MTISQILADLTQGRIGPADAEAAILRLQSSPLGFAHVDLHRQHRCGYPEVVFAEGKTIDWLLGVVVAIVDGGQDCLATRINEHQREALSRQFPKAVIDAVGRTFWYPQAQPNSAVGAVHVLTAGTGDLPVAHEAMTTARALGAGVSLIADVGVAGLHRLLHKHDEWKSADALVVVAGMDGALPSVVGGLASVPVIAVPTSIGYGASFHGVAALLTMLNSCAPNVVVTNIDNGFRGGYVAAMIAKGKHGGPSGH